VVSCTRSVLSLALVSALVCASTCGREDATLDPIVEAEEVLRDLGPTLTPDSSRTVLRTARRAPGRLAYTAPPGGWLQTRVTIPDDAALAFEFGVGTGETLDAGNPLRFQVMLDGAERFATVLDPVKERHHRRWQRERLDLSAHAGREVEIRVGATSVGDGAAAGTPGWTHLHLVRVHRHPRQRSSAAAPNVLLLVVDTLRADALGCYGATPSPSPALDRLAQGGMRFEDVVAHAPWTVPSVTSLFTGLYPRDHGVTIADDPSPDDRASSHLSRTIPTLATLAQRAGVSTFAASSNPLVGPETGLAAGFERFEQMPAADPVRRWASGRRLNERFLRWIDGHRDVRFFAYLHYMEVHSPYATATPPPAPHGASPDVCAGEASRIGRRMRAGEPAPSPTDVAYLRTLYHHAVADWDRMLDELLTGIERRGLHDRTIVVVTADHGEEFAEHGYLGHGKQLFEESIRVPLVVAGPGIPHGQRTEPVQLVDLLPTIAGRLGAPTPAGLPGHDVLGALPPLSRRAFAEVGHGVGFGQKDLHLAIVRERPWKLVWSPDGDRAALFALTDDPGERDARAAESAEVGARLLESVRQYWHRKAATESEAVSPGMRDKLRSLGYAE
jgi:arylsulfatase A-like enzyme